MTGTSVQIHWKNWSQLPRKGKNTTQLPWKHNTKVFMNIEDNSVSSENGSNEDNSDSDGIYPVWKTNVSVNIFCTRLNT